MSFSYLASPRKERWERFGTRRPTGATQCDRGGRLLAPEERRNERVSELRERERERERERMGQ